MMSIMDPLAGGTLPVANSLFIFCFVILNFKTVWYKNWMMVDQLNKLEYTDAVFKEGLSSFTISAYCNDSKNQIFFCTNTNPFFLFCLFKFNILNFLAGMFSSACISYCTSKFTR